MRKSKKARDEFWDDVIVWCFIIGLFWVVNKLTGGS